MATAHDPMGPLQAARVADEVSRCLRDAGFPETAISTWWMLLIDPDFGRTAHRIWEAGEYTTLRELADKTVRDKAVYREHLELLTSDYFATQLAQSEEVRARLRH